MNYNHHSESLPQVYIDQFIKDGVVVIPSVISKQLVDETIVEMNQYLHKSCGFDSTNMLSTAKTLSTLSSTNGSGGILDVYYQHWKLRINEDATVVSILQSLKLIIMMTITMALIMVVTILVLMLMLIALVVISIIYFLIHMELLILLMDICI